MNKPPTATRAHSRHSRIIIDLQAIRDNYQFLKSLAPDSKVIAVIKADAYGHGAIEVARALADADAFAVATSGEALLLREAGIEQKMLVMGGVVDAKEMQDCIDHRLDPIIHQDWQLELLQRARLERPLDVWLKFNSGMGRLGFSAQGFTRALQQVQQIEGLGEVRLMTHLANADDVDDDKSTQQLQQVRQLGLEDFEWGVANSAGILGWPSTRLNWVRTGIALYGSDPLLQQKYTDKLHPAMSFKSQILAINHMHKGQTVGYGGLYTCERDQTIAVVAAGYADGYPRHLQNGSVLVNGQLVPIVGRVSMDMITIDVTDIEVRAGDEVTLWGSEPLAEDIARLSETISYELFCHAGCHGKREYLGQA